MDFLNNKLIYDKKGEILCEHLLQLDKLYFRLAEGMNLS